MWSRPRSTALVLVVCGLVGWVPGSRARAADPKKEPIEAEMLKDLDLLAEIDVNRDGEFLRRMRVLERLGLLEALELLEATTPAPPVAKEEK